MQQLIGLLDRAGILITRQVRKQLLRMGMDLVTVGNRRAYVHNIRRSLIENGMLLNGCEAYHLITLVQATAKVPGAIAELGVFRGGSSRLICDVKGDRELHLFDSFEGLPQLSDQDRGSGFKRGQYRSREMEIRAHVSAFPNVFIHKGWFPQTADAVRDRNFSLVHVDVDLYEPTRDALEFFYPRLSSGGILVSHDCYTPGVGRAFEEFFRNRPEPVLFQPAGSQCFIIKR
jgi:O-methyltransferase